MNIMKAERINKMYDEWMNNSMPCYIERDMRSLQTEVAV